MQCDVCLVLMKATKRATGFCFPHKYSSHGQLKRRNLLCLVLEKRLIPVRKSRKVVFSLWCGGRRWTLREDRRDEEQRWDNYFQHTSVECGSDSDVTVETSVMIQFKYVENMQELFLRDFLFLKHAHVVCQPERSVMDILSVRIDSVCVSGP